MADGGDPFAELPDAAARPERPLSVTQLTHRVKGLLEGELGEVRVEGEISNYVLAHSGHAYFSLKDQTSQVSCVMFRGQHSRLRFAPADGMQVEARGRLSVYVPRGQYQLVVEELSDQGLGALFKAFNALKDKLEREGLFDPARKRPLPFLPRRIGVVTSPTGAAIRDILNVLGRRFANLEVVLYPARVQGDFAPNEIVRGIRRLNELGRSDVLIVGRGGGSIEDLWAFNDEGVARAIAASGIPVISAVGHEIDFTIADFAADLRAPTPSAAAELVSRNQLELLEKLRNLSRRLDRALLGELEALKLRLRHLGESYALRRPLDRLREYQQRVDDDVRRLGQALTGRLESKSHRLSSLTGRLEALNPTAVLQRGYSIVQRQTDGEIVRSARQVRPLDKLKITTGDGDFPATATPLVKAEQQELF